MNIECTSLLNDLIFQVSSEWLTKSSFEPQMQANIGMGIFRGALLGVEPQLLKFMFVLGA